MKNSFKHEMNKDYSDIELAKYFSGAASTEERRLIESWKENSAQNTEMFMAAKFVWEKTQFAEKHGFDVEQALTNVHKKFETPKNKSFVISKSFYIKVLAIAAAVILPVLILFLKDNETNSTNHYNEIVSGAEIKYLKLEDGSEVWLNKESKLWIPEKTLTDEFTLKLEGEAFFQVAHNSKRVFVVETNTALVKVLGTAFNLKAEKDEPKNILSVTEGKVLCSRISSKAEEIVESGNGAEISRNSESIELTKVSDNNFLAWKTKVLKFRETPFKEVSDVLGRYYQIRFEIKDSSLYNLPITTTIVNVPPEEVVKLLHMASDQILISKTSDGYAVSRKK